MSQDRLHDFDKLIRNKFSDHELVPNNDLWDKLETRRNAKKKSERKRSLFLLFFFAFLGLGGLYFVTGDQSTAYSDESSIDSKSNNTTEMIIDQSERDGNTKDLETDQDSNSKSASEEGFSNTNSANNTVSDVAYDDAVVKSENTSSSYKEGQTAGSQNLGSRASIQEEDFGSDMDFLEQQEEAMVSSEFSSSMDVEEADLTELRSSNFGAFERLETISVLDDVTALKDNIKCPIFKIDQKTNNISVEFSFGTALSFHRLSSENEHDIYLQTRKQTEEPLVNYGVNLRLKKEWDNNLTLAAGINATVFNYRYRFVDSMEQRTTVITIDTFYTPQGQEIVTDTLNRVEYGIYEKKSYNKHRLISFPVSLGYSFKMDDYFFEPYGGITFNWRQFTSGDISSISDLRPVSIDSQDEESVVYKNSLGVMYHVGLSVGKQINERLSIMIQPEFHKVLKPISKEDYPVTEERDWINVNLGVKYKLWQRKRLAR